jgi:hypothetical protein
MTTQIEAVIAALEAAFERHQRYHDDDYASVEIANRWVRVLPLDNDIRQSLMLEGDGSDEIENRRLTDHIAAVVSYLRVLRDQGQSGDAANAPFTIDADDDVIDVEPDSRSPWGGLLKRLR